jgi:acetyl-CoA synthetase
MSSASHVPKENISNLSAVEQDYPAPTIVVESALQKDFEREYQRSIEDPAGFWGDYARRFVWTRKWDHVMEWSGASHKWFVGARTNITLSALDRHANGDRRNRVASSGSAKMAPNARSPTASFIGWFAASPMD